MQLGIFHGCSELLLLAQIGSTRLHSFSITHITLLHLDIVPDYTMHIVACNVLVVFAAHCIAVYCTRALRLSACSNVLYV